MKKRVLACICILAIIVVLCACSTNKNDSILSVEFIDVGQGDSALVECDGHYMLIDGGDVQAGDKVYQVLEEKGIQKLDILAISHLHEDHYGGLIKALTYASSIEKTICNSKESNSDRFVSLEQQLSINDSEIEIPKEGDIYKLGGANVEVIDVSSDEPNDSLVLLVTYGDTRFLFTGDIQYSGQKRIIEKYAKGSNSTFKVDVLKMPHHGSWGPVGANDNDLNRLINTFEPEYAVISVGDGNRYGHPHRETLDLLEQAQVKVYRTDKDGDIIVRSDGKTINFETSK